MSEGRNFRFKTQFNKVKAVKQKRFPQSDLVLGGEELQRQQFAEQ